MPYSSRSGSGDEGAPGAAIQTDRPHRRRRPPAPGGGRGYPVQRTRQRSTSRSGRHDLGAPAGRLGQALKQGGQVLVVGGEVFGPPAPQDAVQFAQQVSTGEVSRRTMTRRGQSGEIGVILDMAGTGTGSTTVTS